MSLEDELLKQRLCRIREIEALGYRPYGSRFDFTHTIPEILAGYGTKPAEELVPEVRVRVAASATSAAGDRSLYACYELEFRMH